jgi:acetylornithine/N-succinyldiaminopimelate aminotransferase
MTSMTALMNTYAPLPLRFEYGRGAELFDAAGDAYLDGISGIAVTNLGHAHPRVTEAVSTQAARLLHCSNLFRIGPQEALAERLCAAAGMQRVFFGNSGAEANEAAIKLARLHAHGRGIKRPQIIVLDGAFHGRTLATLSASGSRRIQAGFEPLVGGFIRAPRDDFDAVAAIGERNQEIAAVMVEPVQGESGVRVLDSDYLGRLAAHCRELGWLLIFDEVQCGNGRTGSHFYHQQIGVTPDIMTTAKGLGNGVPIGACLARGAAADVFAPGHHGSTYGGNPLAAAAAGAVLDGLTEDGLTERAEPLSQLVRDSFGSALRHRDIVREVRSAGLMIGIELARECQELAGRAAQARLLINVTAGSTLRLLPPLVMSDTQAEQLGSGLAAVVDQWVEDSP